MAQFSVYKNPAKTADIYPFLVEIQSDFLSDLRSTIVLPLSPLEIIGFKPISRLNPIVVIQGQRYVVMTQELAGISRSILGDVCGSVETYRLEIITAIDFVLSGL
jgi:toxin CcdB